MKRSKLLRIIKELTGKEVFDKYEKYNKLHNLLEHTIIIKNEHIKIFFKYLEDYDFLILNGPFLLEEVKQFGVNNVFRRIIFINEENDINQYINILSSIIMIEFFYSVTIQVILNKQGK